MNRDVCSEPYMQSPEPKSWPGLQSPPRPTLHDSAGDRGWEGTCPRLPGDLQQHRGGPGVRSHSPTSARFTRAPTWEVASFFPHWEITLGGHLAGKWGLPGNMC